MRTTKIYLYQLLYPLNPLEELLGLRELAAEARVNEGQGALGKPTGADIEDDEGQRARPGR